MGYIEEEWDKTKINGTKMNFSKKNIQNFGFFVLLAALAVSACKDSSTSAISDSDEKEIEMILAEAETDASGTQTESNLFVSDGSVKTWDPLYPDASDNRYYNWPANICVETPEFGLNANWVNERNASVISETAYFETLPGYTFEAEWINAWSSKSSSESGGPSFGGWNNVSWTKYSTTINGDAGDYVVQFLADNCSWIYLDGNQIGFQDAAFTNSGNNGKYPLSLNGTDQELSFIIFDGGGEAGGKFRLETLTSYIDNGGDTGDFGTPTNTAPLADAGADQTLNAVGVTTPVTLNGSGSSDADGDALTYSWTLDSNEVSTSPSFSTDLSDGSYTFTLTVSDGTASNSDDVTVTVVNTVPVAIAGVDRTIEATGSTTSITLTGTATDADGDALTYSWSNGSTSTSTTVNLGVGTHTFTFAASDGQGASDSDDVTITIVDTTSPVISFNQEVNSLWPPNHKMVLVATGISSSDLVDGNTEVDIQVSSSEASNGKGDGNTDSDYEIRTNFDGSVDVYVRAERSGKGKNGRTYTITLTTNDAAGNNSMESFDVTVAKSQGRTK